MLRTDPANASLRRQCIDLATELGKFDEVIDLAQAALAADPSDAGALFAKATGLIGRREYQPALEVLWNVREMAGNDPGIVMNMALCHYCLRQFDLARPFLEECYRGGMKTAGLLRLLVTSYHHLGMTEAAVRIAKDNEQEASTDAALAGAYALLYLDTDDVARASKWAKIACELDPKSIDGRVTAATLLTLRMDTDGARRTFEEVVEDVPGTGRAWIGLASLALLSQQTETAKKHLARGLELMPGHVGSWHVLGWTQLMSGEADAAEQTFQRALELDRNFAETHGALAAIAALKGEAERARQLVVVARRLDRACLSAQFAEAVLTSLAGNPAQARSMVLAAASSVAGANGSALSKMLMNATKH